MKAAGPYKFALQALAHCERHKPGLSCMQAEAHLGLLSKLLHSRPCRSPAWQRCACILLLLDLGLLDELSDLHPQPLAQWQRPACMPGAGGQQAADLWAGQLP